MNRVPFPEEPLQTPDPLALPPPYIENLPVAIYACDAKGRVRWFNRKAAELWGREPRLADSTELFCGSYRLWTLDGQAIGRGQTPMAHVLETGERIAGVEAVIERPDGSRVVAMVHIDPVKDDRGRVLGAINCFHETTAMRRAEEDAETQQRTLLSELNHRAKNNVQILQSLIAAAQRETENLEARETLASTSRRIGIVSAAQSAMYAGGGRLNARAFVEELGRHVGQVWGRQADISVACDDGEFANDAAVPLALIFNELVGNAVKYARGDRAHVPIHVALRRDGNGWVLSVADDGPGFVLQESRRRASGLGLFTGLARQLGGSLEVSTEKGARCTVRFADR